MKNYALYFAPFALSLVSSSAGAMDGAPPIPQENLGMTLMGDWEHVSQTPEPLIPFSTTSGKNAAIFLPPQDLLASAPTFPKKEGGWLSSFIPKLRSSSSQKKTQGEKSTPPQASSNPFNDDVQVTTPGILNFDPCKDYWKEERENYRPAPDYLKSLEEGFTQLNNRHSGEWETILAQLMETMDHFYKEEEDKSVGFLKEQLFHVTWDSLHPSHLAILGLSSLYLPSDFKRVVEGEVWKNKKTLKKAMTFLLKTPSLDNMFKGTDLELVNLFPYTSLRLKWQPFSEDFLTGFIPYVHKYPSVSYAALPPLIRKICQKRPSQLPDFLRGLLAKDIPVIKETVRVGIKGVIFRDPFIERLLTPQSFGLWGLFLSDMPLQEKLEPLFRENLKEVGALFPSFFSQISPHHLPLKTSVLMEKVMKDPDLSLSLERKVSYSLRLMNAFQKINPPFSAQLGAYIEENYLLDAVKTVGRESSLEDLLKESDFSYESLVNKLYDFLKTDEVSFASLLKVGSYDVSQLQRDEEFIKVYSYLKEEGLWEERFPEGEVDMERGEALMAQSLPLSF
jgi:hypothetical protein